MATIDLPNNILEALSTVLQQLQQSLPEVKQAPDFSAIAFKWENGELKAIHQLKRIELNDLKGIERQKEKVLQNTEQFLNGLPANDVLLTGSRGTGKSSIVRALLTEYAEQGLRLIEIERDDLSELPEIQKLIAERPEKFIVYCDDLAFNAEDENYRSLKSVLDGSLQSGSSNFIIYATSNRRHLRSFWIMALFLSNGSKLIFGHCAALLSKSSNRHGRYGTSRSASLVSSTWTTLWTCRVSIF